MLKEKITVISALVIISLITFSFTNPKSGQNKDDENKADKVTLKAREAVDKASPDDWYTYAKSAEKCLAKGVNLKEAAEWLDRSIEIKETAYNLELKGDYYRSNKLPDKALEYYVKSLKVGKKQDFDFDATAIQKKIADIYGLN